MVCVCLCVFVCVCVVAAISLVGGTIDMSITDSMLHAYANII